MLVRKKRIKPSCIFVFGAKKMKGLSKQLIKSSLLKSIASLDELGETVTYVVMGNVRETEKVFYSICRSNNLPIALVPADFEKFSYNAEHLRNGVALKFFKPSAIVLAYSSEDAMEEDKTGVTLIRWGKNNKVPVVICGKGKPSNPKEDRR